MTQWCCIIGPDNSCVWFDLSISLLEPSLSFFVIIYFEKMSLAVERTFVAFDRSILSHDYGTAAEDDALKINVHIKLVINVYKYLKWALAL